MPPHNAGYQGFRNEESQLQIQTQKQKHQVVNREMQKQARVFQCKAVTKD